MKEQLHYMDALRSVYWGHCIGCLEMLRKTTDALLLTMGGRDFSALIIVSAVTCLETYLRDRLGRTLFSSNSRVIDHYIYEYTRQYNIYHPRPGDKLTKVPEGEPITEEQMKALGESVKNMNYHQTNKLNDRYFTNVFGINILVDGLSEKIDEIIELRNSLAHSGGIPGQIKINREIDISKAAQVINTITDYVQIVEKRFLKKGFCSVFDETELTVMGIDDLSELRK